VALKRDTHGEYACYLHGCRCDDCTEANRAKSAARRRRLDIAERKFAPCGTRGAWKRGCRCAECVKAARDYDRMRRRQERTAALEALKCGSRSKYQKGCRCVDCTEANRAYNETYLEFGRLNEQRLLHALDALRPDWAERAACRGMTALFFPERGESGHTVTWARQVCAGCPVRTECAEYGLHERFGIWGGMTDVERRALRRTKRPEEAS
jgi:hypothetical protein